MELPQFLDTRQTLEIRPRVKLKKIVVRICRTDYGAICPSLDAAEVGRTGARTNPRSQ